ncbi:hypothetical protein [Telmatospirillum siberiense]|nr:hypothetical protein [Telmatospirillum siberiense]
MSVRQAPLRLSSRRNRLLGFGLGLLSLMLYAGITWRWTRGF